MIRLEQWDEHFVLTIDVPLKRHSDRHACSDVIWLEVHQIGQHPNAIVLDRRDERDHIRGCESWKELVLVDGPRFD